MDTGTILVAALAFIGTLIVGVAVPFFLVRQSARERREDLARQDRQHREDRDAEWARQDEVALKAERATVELAASQKRIADQAAVAAKLLADAQAETIRRTNEVATLAAERDEKVAGQLSRIDAQARRIHTLVNSDMTAARQSERDQTQAMITVLRKVIKLAEDRGLVPEDADVDSLQLAEQRVVDLDRILADRMQQMRAVEEEAARPGAVEMEP
jgi:hypothetical protein